MKSLAAALVAWSLFAGAAHGQSSPAENKADARQHFEAGVANASHTDFIAALREFQLAYQLRPHFSVLYNIGQAYVALGKPVEAAASFEKYLAEGGEQIGQARRVAVQALLDSNRERIGYLRLELPPRTQTQVWLDGVAILPEQLMTPIAVGFGVHAILHFSQGCSPASQQVVIKATGVLDVALPEADGCRQPVAPDANARSAALSPRLPGKAQLRSPSLHPLPFPAEGPRAGKQRRNAFVLGGVALGFLGTAAGLYAWNNGRYKTWSQQSSMTSFEERLNRASSVQRVDDLSIGLVIVGSGTLLGSVWMLLTAPPSK